MSDTQTEQHAAAINPTTTNTMTRTNATPPPPPPRTADMMEGLRSSIEEAQPIQSRDTALDYIGKRGSAVGVTRARRIEYAKELLQKVRRGGGKERERAFDVASRDAHNVAIR